MKYYNVNPNTCMISLICLSKMKETTVRLKYKRTNAIGYRVQLLQKESVISSILTGDYNVWFNK